MKKLLYILLLCASFGVTVAAAEPFAWSGEVSGDAFTLTVEVAPEHYFYVNPTFSIHFPGLLVQPRAVQAPEPVEYDDEFMGKVSIFPAGRWSWRYETVPAQINISYQGCRKETADQAALCLMPQKLQFHTANGQVLSGPLPLPGLAEKDEVQISEEAVLTAAMASLETELSYFRTARSSVGLKSVEEFKTFLSPDAFNLDPVAEDHNGMFEGKAAWLIVLLILLGGLGLNLTPCVLPMIPVNLAIIGADGGGRSTGFWRGLAYGFGMAAAYGILGTVVTFTGARFGELNSSSTFNFVIAGIFLVLSAAMFGVFDLDFSGKIRIHPRNIKGGKAFVAMVLGAMAALLAGACVAPVIIGVLLLSAKLYAAGNVFALGLPFLLGAGMALPWPLLGAGYGILPKPGHFMVVIKNVFGIIILLAALYYLWLGIGLLPGRFSARDQIGTLEMRLAEARTQHKPVLIDFWATWCKNCSEMEQEVLTDPEVKKLLENYVLIRFQAEKTGDPSIEKVLDMWNIPGLPAFVILCPLPDDNSDPPCK